MSKLMEQDKMNFTLDLKMRSRGGVGIRVVGVRGG